MAIIVRAMQPCDEPQAEALWKGLSPYRPGDEAEVEAMYDRATRAREAGSKRWKKIEDPAPHDIAQNASASWVAAVPSADGEDRIVGTVQVTGPTALSQMPSDLPLSREWRLRDHVAELSRLRVADDTAAPGDRDPPDPDGYRLVSSPGIPYAGSQHDHAAEARHRSVQETRV